ncbi:hypothetical protein LTR65_007428 [Meristemomyces frigidus]
MQVTSINKLSPGAYNNLTYATQKGKKSTAADVAMAAAADDDIEPAEIKSAGKSRNKGKKASDVDEEEYVELEATPPAKTKGKKGKAANSADEAEEPKRSGRKKNVVYEDDDADDLDEALKKRVRK